MSDATYMLTEAGALALRVTELEHILRHFDRSTMHLHAYVHSIEGGPNRDEWQLIIDQIDDMVDPYGPRNPHR